MDKYRAYKHDNMQIPVYLWDGNGKLFEENTIEQIETISKLPFAYHHVAAMPDAHLGKGACVGSVIATKINAIIPAATGVDIGCGVLAVKTSLTADDLPDNLHQLRMDIESKVPVGSSPRKRGSRDNSVWHNVPEWISTRWGNELSEGYKKVTDRNPKILGRNNENQLGTLGSGNHFIELCLDDNDSVWIMLHSGSRGPGNKIGTFFIEKAKKLMEMNYINHYLDNDDVAYLIDDPKNPEDIFSQYVGSVLWALEFAKINREVMLKSIIDVMIDKLPEFTIVDEAINCHHNYVTRENHFGNNCWITRKGAISARKDEFGIIPSSMGNKSYIVKGLGNQNSFCSASHGAGRVMSRNQAKKLISVKEHINDTNGVECRKDEGILDESPRAYKNIDVVMKSQSDLVEIHTTLEPILNIKG